MVAGVVAADAGQPEVPGWDPVDGLAVWERELGLKEFEKEAALVDADSGGWS